MITPSMLAVYEDKSLLTTKKVDNGYIYTGAGNIFIKTKPVAILFCIKFDACILNGYVEADYDRVGFDEDITCAGGDIPIVGMFT